MERRFNWLDRLLAAGFVRPGVLISGLRLGRPSLSRCPITVPMALSGLVLEPFAWLQTALYARALKRADLPDDPLVVIGHWRSGTTYLHQLLACDPRTATARNALTIAPQAALVLKPVIRLGLKRWMTRIRPIDAVPWGPDDPQEDEVGLARLTMDTHMAGMAFPRDYLFHFRRSVTETSHQFERQWLHFSRLTWLHDGQGKTQWLIKNSVHTARAAMVLKHFPRARFILLRREPLDAVRSLVQVKQRLAGLVGLQPSPSLQQQVEETAAAHAELLKRFEASRSQIPAGQLLELDYSDLVDQPMKSVRRIYDVFQLSSWAEAEAPLRARIQQARHYRPDPVRLPPEAEQHLRSCMAQS